MLYSIVKLHCHKLKFPFQICSLHFHRVSTKFPPVKDSNSKSVKTVSVSHQLMLDNGIISSEHPGLFTLLPLGLRSVDKLIKLIDLEMKKINSQKVSLPMLTSALLWKKSGRLETCGIEVMRLNDRHNHEFILSPTYEEPITNLVQSLNITSVNLPIRLYQISTKFRDEMRLKHGLMRGREFLMKDLYTFDENLKDAQHTYDEVCKTYLKIFNMLDLSIKKVEASVGSIGGDKSHEFHIPSPVGEDSLMSCKECNYTANSELNDVNENTSVCPNCNTEMIDIKGIEVGHGFLLGTKYSTPLQAKYRDGNGKSHLLQMGCFGIGITRLVAAGIESLSSEGQLVWPRTLAPFKVCLIPPKRGSKEDKSHWCDYFEGLINQMPGYEDEVIVDDRTKLSIGQRMSQAKRFGYPIIIAFGKSSIADIPIFEMFISETKEKLELTQSYIIDYLKNAEMRVKRLNQH